MSPALVRAVRHEEAGSRTLWLGWLALFALGERYALRTRRMTPLTDTVRWVSGARCDRWHGRIRRWAFAAFLAWLGWHIIVKED